MKRLLTAAVAVPLLLLLILRAPAWAFLALVLVVALSGFWELSMMMKKSGQALLPAGYVATALLVVAFFVNEVSFADASLVTLLLLGASTVFTERPGVKGFAVSTMSIFAAFYVGALGGSLVALRTIGPHPAGRRWVIFLLAVVMVGDAGAFYVGRSLGRHPLAPNLSPKKTVEGLFGGLAASVLTACALQALWFPAVPLATAAGLGLMLSSLGVVGDLFESFLKRSVGIKDTSSLIPGHGGVLDRIDSVLFAAPALLLCLRFMGRIG